MDGINYIINYTATVRVTVEDVNEYEPYFLETSYTIVVDEGRLYDRIVQVQAKDDDCSPDFGDICKYELENPAVPFAIDEQGYVKNTEPLDWGKSKNYILSVVAYDCGLKASKAVLVNIGVNRICSPQWQGIKEQVDYIPDFTPQPIFAAASLDLCGARCDAGTPSANIKLSTEHIGKGCDRDTYSSKSQRKLCGASEDVFEFLPSQGATWTDALHKDEGQESDQVFKFDGESGAVLPPEVMQDGLTETFSLALWMKHEENVTLDKHAKEHIVCNADDHKMNRHHFSLFVRNCRLILLLRREYSEANLSTFAPAEWRWKLPEVCDGEWHHYVLNAQLPKLTLFIDGALRKDTKHNPEIIDDWPLHPVRGVQRKLTVGACWRGVSDTLVQLFTGYLGSVTLTRGAVEKESVIHCLHTCKESLHFGSLDDLQPGAEISFDRDMSMVKLRGRNIEQLTQLLRNMSYVNLREFPTPGHRKVTVVTDIDCVEGDGGDSDGGGGADVPAVETYVVVQQADAPSIVITGTPNMAHGYEQIQDGINVFGDVSISVTHGYHDTDDEASILEHQLDSCVIMVDSPSLDPDQEYFTVPTNLMVELGLDSKQTQDGLIIAGVDKVYNYEDVLRQVNYYNNRPAFYLSRTFKLKCSELNGRFNSNEFRMELSVIHSHPKPPERAYHAAQQHMHVNIPRFHENSLHELRGKDSLHHSSSTVAGNAVTVIVVICVGFLVFMVVVGVIRIRSAQQQDAMDCKTREEQVLKADSLTITVNPMQEHNDEDDDDDSESGDEDDDEDEGSLCHDDYQRPDKDDIEGRPACSRDRRCETSSF